MVAVKGKGWKLAPSLVQYVAQADRLYPGRDVTSDGSIGDQAHASRQSDHNPHDGWVHAVDLDEDLAPGLDLKDFADALRRSQDRRIRYVIYEGRIFKSYESNRIPAWTWQSYTGPNAHSHHLHLSINRTAAAREDLTAWPFEGKPKPAPQEDDYMAVFITSDPADPTWYVYDGFRRRPLKPGENQLLVDLGLVKPDAKGKPLVKVIGSDLMDRIPTA